LLAVGHVTAQWACLETQIDFTLSALLAVRTRRDPEQYLIKPFKQRVRLWRELVPKLVDDAAIKSGLTKIMDRAAQLYHKRNLVVHGVWFQNPRDGFATNLTYRQDAKLQVQAMKLNTNGIEKLAADIRKVTADLVDLVGAPQPEFLYLPPSKQRWRRVAYYMRQIPGTAATLSRQPHKRGGA
jgi:hypothetical protein